MKKILFVLSAAVTIQLAIGQTKEGNVIYERKTNMHKRLPPENENMKNMIPEFNSSKVQLLFSGNESLFKALPQQEDIRDQTDQGGNRMVIRMGGDNSEIYKNYATEKMVEGRELGPKKYIIEDTLRKLSWKLREETMTVSGHHCKKATTVSRQGDNIVAWYTDDIPVPTGPDQFGGLPGLILLLDMGDGWVVFTAQEIQTTLPKNLVKAPNNGKKITRKEFQKMMDDAFGPTEGGRPRIRIVTSDGE